MRPRFVPGLAVVATAHNLDDHVQTFMMNLMHGDVERLGWFDPSVVDGDFPFRRVKPFMEIYEEEIALYAHLTGLPFQNASCPYMHEGLRSEVRDYLNDARGEASWDEERLAELGSAGLLEALATAGPAELGPMCRLWQAVFEGPLRRLQDERASPTTH